ncbi:hypothetical protein F5Y13DRAFT_604 [Hypoxylon sp. FL1857]|nr:hypothetical protein F5Y13DRAFT_604 [Hypoxylon sp. FL1857]
MANNSATPLIALPLELIEHIIECLLPRGSLTIESELRLNPTFHISKTALSNVCLTSRMLHNIASRYLYQIVVLEDQRALFCFSRTLAARPDLRPLVQSFAWLGVIDNSRPPHGTVQLPLASSPNGRLTFHIGYTLNNNSSSPLKLAGLKVFESVLVNCPKLRILFTHISSPVRIRPYVYPSPEYVALHRVFDGRAGAQPRSLKEQNAQDDSVGASSSDITTDTASPRQFLRELETFIVAPRSSTISLPGHILWSALSNCPSLKRIEAKRSIRPPLPSRAQVKDPTPTMIAENIKDISIREAKTPEDISHLTIHFPNLTMLSMEFEDEAVQDPHRLSNALLRLRHTLRTLRLTTTPGKSWKSFYSPSLLSPILKNMQALRELTTECIWLFDSLQDPPVGLDLGHLLPSSLIDFHLIDYWGVSKPTEFYQNSPAGVTPTECRERIFSSLHHGCSTHLSNLRNVEYTPQFSVGYDTPRDDMEGMSGIADFTHRYEQLFMENGVHFSVLTPEEWIARLHSLKANIF